MTRYSPKEIEKEILGFWEKKKIPDRIVKFDPKKPKFYLLDGPPYVNYVPHVGHIKTTAFKDIWGKFKFMQGFSVWFQPGFDCSGLPIENAVEKKLGIKTKKDIMEKVGIDRFIQECKGLAEKNKPIWMDIYRKLAAWKGWLEPYLTYKNYYLESGWWTVKKLFDKGLFVEGHKPGFWCSHCETVLAGYEVTDSYKNVEDPSIFIKFPVKGKKDEFFLVWTTTPWTLPSNVCIAAHPEEKYVKVEIPTGEKLILAEKRVDVLSELEISYKVVEKFTGKDLNGMKYTRVVDTPLQKEMDEKFHYVIMSIKLLKKRAASKVGGAKKDEFEDFVTTESGTGLVHTAPGLGDYKVGEHYNLAFLSPVDDEGKFTEDAGKYKGIYVKEADRTIIEDLQKSGKLLHVGKIVHSYPLCWRCKTPLIYRMSKQWFLKVDTVRDGMIKENEGVRWLPGFASERFVNVLADAPDWAITRQRFWGIPLPIWVCGKCGTKKVIGSKEELRKEAAGSVPKDLDLHKNTVDKIKIKCQCGSSMERVPDIMDVWFDSGIAPWASLGYPFKNEDVFKRLWPVDLIDESQDQVRGWFYSLMFCGFAAFDKKPYNTVCLNGWTLDEKGDKMSKSVGNVTWAEDGYNRLGADLMRLYYCYGVAPWDTQKFSMKGAEELGRALNVLWNTYQFIRTYSKKTKGGKSLLEDAWIISKTNSLIGEVTDDLENFRFHYAGRKLVDFILNEFSRWYIKIIRPRVSPQYTGKDKQAAQHTLVYVLEKVVKLLAPITPFISEKIYQDFYGDMESVHLCPWPKADRKLVDSKLEENMKVVKVLIEVMGSARQEKDAKLRWPLTDIRIAPKDKKAESAVNSLKDIVLMMGNVKEVKIVKKLDKGKAFEFGKLEIGNVLKDEALIRELVRNVQVLRKKAGLDVHDRIVLHIKTDKETQKLLKQKENDILKGVGGTKVLPQIKAKKGEMVFEGKKIEMGFEKV